MLNDKLLSRYIGKFYGYGSYQAPIWFIGMEEGGAGKRKKVGKRLSAWKERGCKEVEDLAEFHRAFGVKKFWRKRNPPTQRTWNKLIRLLLSGRSESGKVTLKEVKAYQRDHLGRIGSETCLLELLPLPSPKTNKWKYKKWSNIPELKDRSSYRKWLTPERIKHIRKRIKKHQPRIVVFYGLSYVSHWKEIAAVEFHKDESHNLHIATTANTTFVITPHPSAERSKHFWHKLGQLDCVKARV